MFKSLFKKYSESYLLIISLAVLLCCFFALNLPKNLSDFDYFLPDSYSYVEAASSFYNDLSMHPIRPMVYPALIGVPFLFGADQVTVIVFAIILNIIFWFVSILLLYKSILLITNSKKLAFLAGLIFSCSFSIIGLIFHPLTEITFLFLTIFSSYMCIQFFKTENLIKLYLAVSLLLLSILVRPGVLYISIIFFLMLIIFSIQRKKVNYKSILILLVPFFLIGFQMSKMSAQFGIASISYVDKYTWYVYIGSQIEADLTGKKTDEVSLNRRQELSAKASWKEKIEIASKSQKKDITREFKSLLRNYSSNVFTNLIDRSISIEFLKMAEPKSVFAHVKNFFLIFTRLFNIAYGLIMVLMTFYIIFKIKKVSTMSHLFFIYILYNILISGIAFWQGDRFSLVCYPVALLLGASLFYNKRIIEQQQEK